MTRVQHFPLVCHINDIDHVMRMIMSKMIKTIENKDDYEKREGMPKMNGFELYNEIRRIDDKVCFITAFDIYTKR
jgi:hypothetical protein